MITETINKAKVGERIKSIRLEMGYTLKEFGELFNTGKVTVFNWEKGRNLPNNERLINIAFQGQMSVDELLHGKFCTWREEYYDHEITEIAGCETENQPLIEFLENYKFNYCPYCGKELKIAKADYLRQFTAELNIGGFIEEVDIDTWDESLAWDLASDQLENDDDEVIGVYEHKPKRTIKGQVIT